MPERASVSRVWDALRKSDYLADKKERRDDASPFGLQIPVQTVQIRPESRIVAHTDPRGPTADRLRLLRLRLNQVWNAEKLKKLLITSPLPHDGKSTIALNLAVTLSEEGNRAVLLIEGDLHRAALSRELGMDGRPGVAEYLENDTDPCSCIQRIEPLGCYFLPAGQPKGNPSELLQKGALSRMMDSLSPHFDWILIDSPPVVPLTDALSWKERSDGTLLVARAGRTPAHAVEDALTLLGRKHVLAIILNGEEGLDRAYKQYYKTYNGDASL